MTNASGARRDGQPVDKEVTHGTKPDDAGEAFRSSPAKTDRPDAAAEYSIPETTKAFPETIRKRYSLCVRASAGQSLLDCPENSHLPCQTSVDWKPRLPKSQQTTYTIIQQHLTLSIRIRISHRSDRRQSARVVDNLPDSDNRSEIACCTMQHARRMQQCMAALSIAGEPRTEGTDSYGRPNDFRE